jgi:hypothetical protein
MSPRPGSLMPPEAVAGAAVMSLIQPNCRHAPGGSDSKDNTKVIKQKAGAVAGAGVTSRDGRLPLYPGNICPFYG